MQHDPIKEIKSASSAPLINIQNSSPVANSYPQDMSKTLAVCFGME